WVTRAGLFAFDLADRLDGDRPSPGSRPRSWVLRRRPRTLVAEARRGGEREPRTLPRWPSLPYPTPPWRRNRGSEAPRRVVAFRSRLRINGASRKKEGFMRSIAILAVAIGAAVLIFAHTTVVGIVVGVAFLGL